MDIRIKASDITPEKKNRQKRYFFKNNGGKKRRKKKLFDGLFVKPIDASC